MQRLKLDFSAVRASSILILLVAWLPAQRVHGHGDTPPVPLPPEMRERIRADYYRPLRWSWLHWWEANRDPYLVPLTQAGPLQRAGPEALAQLRQRAGEALFVALRADSEALRMAASISLGRIRAEEALDSLQEKIDTDLSATVRQSAMCAVGLIDNEPSQAYLLQTEYATESLQLIGLADLGLAREPEKEALDLLRRTTGQFDRPPAATIAAWSLHQHASDQTVKLFKQVLSKTVSPWIASEAMLALGEHGDAEAQRLLVEVALANQRGQRLPAWRELVEIDKKKTRARAMLDAGAGGSDLFREAHERFARLNPNPPPPEDPDANKKVKRMLLGLEEVYMSRLRASAAIALRQVDRPESVQALLAVLDEREDDFNSLPKSFAIMSLGLLATRQALPALMRQLDTDRDQRGHQKTQEQINSPLRGFAALALGLYARPANTAQGPYDRPGFDKAMQRLVERLADDRETDEVRSACAVALGLSRRTANLPMLRKISERLDAVEQPLVGYLVLARGMLGDGDIIEPAGRLLALERDDTELTGILTRRAVVLGLGLLARADVIPVLTEAWHLSYYVNREVILALALSGTKHIGEHLITELTQAPDPLDRAFMAEALGQILAPQRPTPLARMINHTNFTMKNEQRLPLQNLANRFLFSYLIPSFDRPWQ